MARPRFDLGLADWPLIVAALLALPLCLFYGFGYAYWAPVPGLDWDANWRVGAVASCDGRQAWCEAVGESVRPGDRLLEIGDLTFDEYRADRLAVPFAGYEPGDKVPLVVERDGQIKQVIWEMPPVLSTDRLERLLGGSLLYLPFWIAGSLVLLFLRPRDSRWRVLILMFYLTAIWLAAGSTGAARFAYSNYFFSALTWLLLPVYLHLHLIVPSPLFPAIQERLVRLLYLVVLVPVIAAFRPLTPAVTGVAFILFVTGSLGLLIVRFRRGPSVTDRIAARWMLAGIGLAFVPGALIWAIPTIAGRGGLTLWTSTITSLAVVALPTFYTYAVYKRHLGALEFRANRLIGLYAFVLIYVTLYTLAFAVASRFFGLGSLAVLFGLVVSVLFVALGSGLRERFQRAFERLAYGERADPTALAHAFASRVPTASDLEELVRLLRTEILAPMFVRQSAILLFDDHGAKPLYLQEVDLEAHPVDEAIRSFLLSESGSYRAPDAPAPAGWEWVRLVVPLEVRGVTIGVWVFGRRDPDDFYPKPDVDLVLGIGRQVSLTIENARLLEEARQRAAQLEALNAIIAEAVVVGDPRRFLEHSLTFSMQALGTSLGGIWLDRPALFRGEGLPEDLRPALTEFLEHADMDLTAGPLAVEDWDTALDYERIPAHLRAPRDFGLRASLTAPLIVEGEPGGLIVFGMQQPRQWTAAEVSLVEAIGRQVGSAIERLRLLRQVQQQAEQLQRILETVQEGIFVLDDESRIVLANPVARQILADLEGAAEGEHLRRLGNRRVQDLLEPRRDGLPHEVRQPEGNRIFEVLATPTPLAEERQGWTMLIRDVTEAREIQKRFYLQDRLAAVGQLAAGIAHDFNNILAAITLFSEMLLDEPDLTEKGRERLAMVLQQAERATTLTRQILDFGRQTVMEVRPMDLAPFLKEFEKLMERTLPENIRLGLHIGEGPFYVQGDPGRLQQVFMNLAVNARDAMPEGGELHIEMERWQRSPEEHLPFRDMQEGPWIRIRVRDSGKGIEPDVLPRIFDPFFTTKPAGRGTGLGLAQVYGILKQHGGYIDVESRVGEGTTFTIYLPPLEIPTADEVPRRAPATTRGDGETVLVVEDQPATRQAIQEILESLNYQVRTASNGREALETLARDPDGIQVVLSDMVMPEMGGVALYRELRERFPHLPLVLMTGYPLGTETRELLERQQVVWLQKPVDAQRLAEVIQAALHGQLAPSASRRGLDF